MPIYVFRTESGDLLEEWFHVEHAPVAGRWTEIDGQKAQRIYTVPQVVAHKDVHFVSQSLERNHPDAPAVNEKGQPVFESRKQVEEFCAKTKTNDPNGGLEWGEL